MADTGQKVETKAGKVDIPDDAPDKTLAAQDTAVNPEELDGETVKRWVFLSAQTTALAIELTAKGATGLEETVETTSGAGDNTVNSSERSLADKLFSAFTSHVIKTKNHNRSMNKVKNLGYNR